MNSCRFTPKGMKLYGKNAFDLNGHHPGACLLRSVFNLLNLGRLENLLTVVCVVVSANVGVGKRKEVSARMKKYFNIVAASLITQVDDPFGLTQ